MSSEQTQSVLSEIRERVVRVETKLDDMTNYRDVAYEANKTAQEADQRARSAHHRIDKIDKVFFWLGTTVVGAIIIGMITFALKGGLNQ